MPYDDEDNSKQEEDEEEDDIPVVEFDPEVPDLSEVLEAKQGGGKRKKSRRRE